MMKTLGELNVQICGGQIISRIAATDDDSKDSSVVIPKCIHADGTIQKSEMAVEKTRTVIDPAKLTEEGDIVVKLSTPYDAAMVNRRRHSWPVWNL